VPLANLARAAAHAHTVSTTVSKRRGPRRGSRFADVATQRYAAYDLRWVSKENRVDVSPPAHETS